MKSMSVHSPFGLNRRTALGRVGIAAAALGLGLGAQRRAVAQEATTAAHADHPLTGAWLAMTPSGPAPSIFTAGGSVVLGWPVTQAGPQGVTFASSWVGTWEPTGERTTHFTATQVLSEANGTLTGTATVDGHPRVSEDGQTFIDDDPESAITIRDPAGAVVQTLPGGGVTGSRMGVGSPGFPAGTPAAGTPTS